MLITIEANDGTLRKKKKTCVRLIPLLSCVSVVLFFVAIAFYNSWGLHKLLVSYGISLVGFVVLLILLKYVFLLREINDHSIPGRRLLRMIKKRERLPLIQTLSLKSIDSKKVLIFHLDEEMLHLKVSVEISHEAIKQIKTIVNERITRNDFSRINVQTDGRSFSPEMVNELEFLLNIFKYQPTKMKEATGIFQSGFG